MSTLEIVCGLVAIGVIIFIATRKTVSKGTETPLPDRPHPGPDHLDNK